MSSMNHVTRQLEEMGLTVAADGEVIFCEDPDLDFTRSHDGIRGISRWFAEVKEEYAMAINDLLSEDKDEEFAETKAAIEEEIATWSEDEQRFQDSLEETVTETQEFAPAPPEKEHAISSAQLALAKKLNEALMSPKEIWQAAQGQDQDRGSVPNPADYIRDMKLGVVHSAKAEFEVSGIGYVTGEFKRRFTEKGTAQDFARACVAAAKSPRYASTVRIMTV